VSRRRFTLRADVYVEILAALRGIWLKRESFQLRRDFPACLVDSESGHAPVPAVDK
jgi:hypothetical protein